MNKKAILAITALVVAGMAAAPYVPDVTASGGQDSWIETFDSYETGQLLDGEGGDDGGWMGWDDDPAFAATVVDTYAMSDPHSIEVGGPVDAVQLFEGYDSGQWTFYANQYIPEDFQGTNYFLMLDQYEHNDEESRHWAVVISYNSESGMATSEGTGRQLPMKTGEWVQIKVNIDFEDDWYQFYYDGMLLEEKEWTAGWNDDGNGQLQLRCLDLFANGASPVYWDNLALVQQGHALGASGSLSWTEVEPGAEVTGSFKVQNVVPGGDPLDWEIASTPDWGEWTFEPSSGEGLTNADGLVTVEVTVVAPDESNTDFSGEVTVVNSDNSEDTATIPVTLATPYTGHSLLYQFVEMLVHQFPLLQPLLSLL